MIQCRNSCGYFSPFPLFLAPQQSLGKLIFLGQVPFSGTDVGAATAVDAQEVATKVSKTIENGQVVIIREGVKYDVTGRAIGK